VIIEICVQAPCTEISIEDVEYTLCTAGGHANPKPRYRAGAGLSRARKSRIFNTNARRAWGDVAGRYVTRHTSPISFCQIWQGSTVYFYIFMGRMHAAESCMRCMVVSHPPAGAPGSTVRVEVLRLPPLTLFALGDHQSSASARTHNLQLCIPSYASNPRVRSWT
jgi:hypothetical protein